MLYNGIDVVFAILLDRDNRDENKIENPTAMATSPKTKIAVLEEE